MFIKEYRKPLSENANNSKKLWLKNDLKNAPSFIIENLHAYLQYRNINPYISNATSVSFQYANSNSFIIRDIGHFSLICNTLLDKKFGSGFQNTINSFSERVSVIDDFLNPFKSYFNDLKFNRNTYHKSIVIGLNQFATNIEDIDYVDIYFDTDPYLFVTNKPIEPKILEKNHTVHRRGFSFRIYFTPCTKNLIDLRLVKETSNCIETNTTDKFYQGKNYNRKEDVVNQTYSDCIVHSMEYYFSFHVDSIDEMVNLIINQQKYQIERKLGFDFDKVDNSIIDLIKMVMI